MGRLKTNESGNIYGRLTVLHVDEENVGKNAKWICRCECGTVKSIQGRHLRSGNTQSCGCFSAEQATKHGFSNHPLYSVFDNIKKRCYDQKFERYKDWGGRGIKVCQKWIFDREAFFTWALDNGWEQGLQLDRIDNDGDYSPENCRFVSNRKNSLNTDRIQTNNKSGFIGVSKHKSGKWVSSLRKNGILHYLGIFVNISDAVQARNLFISKNGLNQEYKIQSL